MRRGNANIFTTGQVLFCRVGGGPGPWKTYVDQICGGAPSKKDAADAHYVTGFRRQSYSHSNKKLRDWNQNPGSPQATECRRGESGERVWIG